jgi:hypothetical protein
MKDYALTIDTAKEISMLQRTEKEKQARYFIECEKSKRTHLECKIRNALLIENEALKLDNERMSHVQNLWMVFNTTSLIDMER